MGSENLCVIKNFKIVNVSGKVHTENKNPGIYLCRRTTGSSAETFTSKYQDQSFKME
jgi:hypothetical protein